MLYRAVKAILQRRPSAIRLLMMKDFVKKSLTNNSLRRVHRVHSNQYTYFNLQILRTAAMNH